MTVLMRAMRRRSFLFVAAAAMLPTGRVTLALADDPAPAKVTVDNFTFTPASLTVKAGTKVMFVNHDDIPHSIVCTALKMRSKALDTDQSFEFTFAAAGDYDYFCGLHPHMKGKIIVSPE